MQEIHFDPAGLALFVNIRYESDHGENMFVTYTYKLWEANSGVIVDQRSGNNFNDDDDRYLLPTPVERNHERVVDVTSIIKNAGDQAITADMIVEIFQGSHRIDFKKEEVEVPALSSVIRQVFIKLVAA